jgi:hypothetical protein
MTAAIEFNVTAKRSSSRLFFEGSEIRSWPELHVFCIVS